MLYMEDYLEMIEHLPQELKDRFTEIRELDLQVQNATDKLDERMKLFFSNAKKMKLADKEAEFEALRKEYYKTLEDADEKVHQANQMYDLVDRYLRRLDQELHKFKMELEADNAGITEVLEKRSLEMDQKDREKENYSSQKENRLLSGGGGLLPSQIPSTSTTITSSSHHQQFVSSIKSEKKSERKSSMDKTSGGLGAGAGGGGVAAYSLGHMGVGSTAIAAAASQAIAATQQMQQGRRTASLKASYDAINSGLHTQEFSVGRELLANTDISNAAQQALAATTGTSSSSANSSSSSSFTASSNVEQKRNKRKSQHHTTQQNQQELMPQLPELEEPLAMETGNENPDWTYDPSEPRYCICNQVSYGDMVACDNEDCPIEWFHYPCVGITATPKGKWYCPQCSASMRRRGRR